MSSHGPCLLTYTTSDLCLCFPMYKCNGMGLAEGDVSKLLEYINIQGGVLKVQRLTMMHWSNMASYGFFFKHLSPHTSYWQTDNSQ